MNMTQDEIIETAAEIWNAGSSFPIPSSDDILHFAKLVAEKEREANAKMVDHILKEGGGTWGDAIRARGQA
jgi:hypothetical protein